MGTVLRIMLVALLLALLVWIIEATVDSLIFDQGSFWDRLILDIPTHELYMRGVTVLFLFGFGVAMGLLLEHHESTESALRASENLLQSLFTAAPLGVLVVQEDGRIMMANTMAETIFRYDRDEILDQPIEMLVPDRLRIRHAQLCAEYFRNPYLRPMGLDLELVGQRSDGSEFPLEITLNFVETGGRTLTLVIVMDMTHREEAEEALRTYAAELESRNEELDAFAHTVAHDLKVPLSQSMGFAELLTTESANMRAEDVEYSLQAIARSGHKMTNIIDELMLLASVRKEDIASHPLDMASIVTEAEQRVSHLVNEHQATITIPPDWPVAMGHAPWIEEVWTNYLSNAAQYGGPLPQIELGFDDPEPGFWRFWVRDLGPGIEPEDQAQLFTPFKRLTQVRSQGHGLGLSIVRRIVEKLGGEVGVASEVGQGSTFWFTLPKA